MQFDINRAEELLKRAEKKGATGGDLIVVEGDSFSAQVRLKEVEKISNARGKSLGLRVFFGKRSAITSTSDLSPASLDRLVEDTCTLAQIAAEDPFAGLPPPELLAKHFPELDLVDTEVEKLPIEKKIDLARRAEQAALESDPRLTNSEGADFGHYHTFVLFASSNGFHGHYETTGASLSAMPIATQDGQMQRDYWYSSRRKLKDMESPEAIGKKAAMRTLRRLGARKVSTQQVPVIFDPENAASLLGHLASAISGYSIYKGASFLIDKLGTQIASNALTVYDDPTLRSGLGSRPFDGEGLPSYKKTVVENGVLKTYLLDTYSGKKLNLPSTGNAVRGISDPPSVGTSNFHMKPGKYTPQEIIRSVKSGLYVTELIGFGVNSVTGDYSRGAVGLWIENGELAYPVEEITIAGNLKEMFQQIEMVGNDLDPWRKTAAPTLKITRMTVAGN
ncbi:MAG: TldD/PmbA family protein [Candidatus Manganitrophaceae bacterium]|nr:MAG: TldD/PmbA family protein [Candidatus Manganitrophaceae bacterium]